MGAVSCTLRHIADFFGPAFLTLFYFSLGLMMILTLMLFGVVVSNHRSTAEVSQCHVDLENSAVDLNEFYPSLDEPIKLPLLRYSYDWNGKGLEDSCAVVLEKCEICDCKENETALLVEARDWNVTCKILPKAALAVDRRNIGDKDDSQDEDQSSPIQPDNSELAGPLPSASPAGAYSALRARVLYLLPHHLCHHCARPRHQAESCQIRGYSEHGQCFSWPWNGQVLQRGN